MNARKGSMLMFADVEAQKIPAAISNTCLADNLRIGKFSPNRSDGVEAVHLRHLQVHNRDIRAMRTELLDCLAPIRCLGHQSHIGLRTEKHRDALPYQNMIVNRKNPDLSWPFTHVLSVPSHLYLSRTACQNARRCAWILRTLSLLEY